LPCPSGSGGREPFINWRALLEGRHSLLEKSYSPMTFPSCGYKKAPFWILQGDFCQSWSTSSLLSPWFVQLRPLSVIFDKNFEIAPTRISFSECFCNLWPSQAMITTRMEMIS
jgi:hypothetical protein